MFDLEDTPAGVELRTEDDDISDETETVKIATDPGRPSERQIGNTASLTCPTGFGAAGACSAAAVACNTEPAQARSCPSLAWIISS